MKKISNAEVCLHSLRTNDIVATSDPKFGASVIDAADQIGVSSRDYYDE